MTIFNLLLLVLVSVFSTESMDASGGGCPTVSYEYDELLLALQWPTSFCSTHECDYKSIPDSFTVHGLWLNNNSCPVICPKANPPIHLPLKVFSLSLLRLATKSTHCSGAILIY